MRCNTQGAGASEGEAGARCESVFGLHLVEAQVAGLAQDLSLRQVLQQVSNSRCKHTPLLLCCLFLQLQALEVMFGVKFGSAEDFAKEEQQTQAAAAAAAGGSAAAAAAKEDASHSSKENQPSSSNTAASSGAAAGTSQKVGRWLQLLACFSTDLVIKVCQGCTEVCVDCR